MSHHSLTCGATARPAWRHVTYVADVLFELIIRDVRLRYKRSLIGAAWTLLSPLGELAVLLFVFSVILPLDIPNYAAFLFTGISAYGWFQSSLFFSTGAIVHNRELVKRPGFPVAVLPVVAVGSNLLHFLLAFPVLLGLILACGTTLSVYVAAIPFIMLIQFVMTLSLAYLVAAVNVVFRDTEHILKIALQLLWYLTPVFYSVDAVPQRFRALYAINPLAVLLDAYRAVLLHGQPPPVMALLTIGILAGALLGGTYSLFSRANVHFAEEV